MKIYLYAYLWLLIVVFCTACRGQNSQKGETIAITNETNGVILSHGPDKITRNIIQDRKGNIWMAAFDGIFRYNGTSFTNITGKVSSARFFSILEDKKGDFWFGSIGSGVYKYDGRSFWHFTTSDGLLNNEVGSIYEDKQGNVWLGVSGGVSHYDRRSFKNYVINGNVMTGDNTGKTFEKRQRFSVNSIVEDKTGRLWFGTTGDTFIYDGKTFAKFTNSGKSFKNVRSIIEDSKGSIWLGGQEGLWRYNGAVFTSFSQNFTGHIYEDNKGDILTSAEEGSQGKWALYRFDEESLTGKKPPVKEVSNKPIIFGVLEATDQSIWFGSFGGVYRYDGKTITSFNSNRDYK